MKLPRRTFLHLIAGTAAFDSGNAALSTMSRIAGAYCDCRDALDYWHPEATPVLKVALGPTPLPPGFLLSRTRPVLPSCNRELPTKWS
jgi:hypothetical protein